MIQLAVIAGGSAGRRFDVAEFPQVVGRADRCSVVIADRGVFSEHFQIDFTAEGFLLSAKSEAEVTVNGERAARAVLRNGDVIGAGLAKIQFWLGALPQRALKAREVACWVLIAAVAGAQFYFFAGLLAMAR